MGSAGNAERGKVEVELKGKTYTVLELDLQELGEMENFVKSKYARLYRQSADGVKPAEREKQVMKILREPIDADRLSEEMTAYDCLYYAAYLMLQYNPGVTRDTMKDIVDQGNLHIINTAMGAFGGGEDEGNPPEETEPEIP